MKYNCYPKVNLSLLISKKSKKNNLHKIKSIFCLVKNFYDVMEIEINNKSDSIKYFFNNEIIEIKDCIIKKTLSTLRNKNLIDDKLFFTIKIQKNIPMFSGLGGGSSNAGCLIKYLIERKILAYKKNLNKVFLEIGSDVCFFVSSYDCAIVKGYGEKIKNIKKPKSLSFEIFTNDIKCSTKKVFERFDEMNFKKNAFWKQIYYFKNNKYNLLVNELEKVCIYLYPEINDEINKIKKETDKFVFLSGSGSSLFIIK